MDLIQHRLCGYQLCGDRLGSRNSEQPVVKTRMRGTAGKCEKRERVKEGSPPETYLFCVWYLFLPKTILTVFYGNKQKWFERERENTKKLKNCKTEHRKWDLTRGKMKNRAICVAGWLSEDGLVSFQSRVSLLYSKSTETCFRWFLQFWERVRDWVSEWVNEWVNASV